jgi:pyruvate/2-oxoacid:ferredoxin oxidoreductase alpha subunit
MKKNKDIRYLSGNIAVALGAIRARLAACAAYPITPQTSIIEEIAKAIDRGLLQAELLRLESEHSVMAACIALASTGVRVFTATSSQGLALMAEMVYWAAGERWPIVMANVNRALGGPWILYADFSDSDSLKDSGWIQIYCANAQEALDNTIMAFKLAETLSLPVMVNEEGFVISHAYQPVIVPTQKEIDAFLPPYKADSRRIIDPTNPIAIGGITLPDQFTETRYQIHEAMLRVPKEMRRIAVEYQKVVGRRIPVEIETRNLEKCHTILVGRGVVTETMKDVVAKNSELGLIKIKMFRPFPREALTKALDKRLTSGRPINKIIVIDRSLSYGQGSPLWVEFRSWLYSFWRRDAFSQLPHVLNYLTGLGGQDLTPEVIENIIRHAAQNDDDQKPICWRR